MEVPVKTLEALCELWRNALIGLLIIDVEGFEREVFRGSAGLLRSQRPRLVMFESLNQQLDPMIGSLLNDAGYRVFQLDDSGILRCMFHFDRRFLSIKISRRASNRLQMIFPGRVIATTFKGTAGEFVLSIREETGMPALKTAGAAWKEKVRPRVPLLASVPLIG